MAELQEFEELFNKDTKTYLVFQVLKDKQWHCRECEYAHTGITQIAGGAGIQGLQRGNRTRNGMEIHSDNHLCATCDKTTRHDKWTGNFVLPLTQGNMPSKFAKRVVDVLGSRDIVELTKRPANQLTIDHKLPMLRWDESQKVAQTSYDSMSDKDIMQYFQLLKKSNGSVSHNLLKSRSCEDCWKTGKRGSPFGIKFYCSGTEDWSKSVKIDADGCIGCGWYDFNEWRNALNKNINGR